MAFVVPKEGGETRLTSPISHPHNTGRQELRHRKKIPREERIEATAPARGQPDSRILFNPHQQTHKGPLNPPILDNSQGDKPTNQLSYLIAASGREVQLIHLPGEVFQLPNYTAPLFTF